MKKEDTEGLKTALMGEALLFSFLSRAVYQEPDKEWLDSLVAGDLFREAPFGESQDGIRYGIGLLQAWSKANARGIAEPEFEAIKKDYLYLFIGAATPLAPIWESVYFNRGRLVFQKETLEVRHWYARFGLEAEHKGQEPDDHLGLELSFVAHLATLALQSFEAGDEIDAENALQAQRDFLAGHLFCWVLSWADLVQIYAETDFYRGIAHLTVGALRAAAELLEIEMPKENVT